MTFKWKKLAALDQAEEARQETWFRMEEGKEESFDVSILKGKKTDLLSLKKDVVGSIKTQVERFRESRTRLYAAPDHERVASCPVCEASSTDTREGKTIYGAHYRQCNVCSHVYVVNRPSRKTISNFYLSDVNYASTYTNKTAAESRLNAIAKPWLDWTQQIFQQAYGRLPRSVLDVGSGAGHFVEACRRAGMTANGVELSESSRTFAREVWGFELDGGDFCEVHEKYTNVDIVTFWGLLEHTPNPSELVACARKILCKDGGMIIAKLPRWHSISSAAQKLYSESVIRHLDPMGHIMAFTDSSAAEMFHRCGLRPSHAWYYGMDIYEMLMQMSVAKDEFSVFVGSGPEQVELQQAIDNGTLSDGLTIAVVPR
jgi:2-polyprenyl-3-methyl-5-hydroxy-6-metoxy-1,4-benzoquinol methylase